MGRRDFELTASSFYLLLICKCSFDFLLSFLPAEVIYHRLRHIIIIIIIVIIICDEFEVDYEVVACFKVLIPVLA
jgi:hypothetical protein